MRGHDVVSAHERPGLSIIPDDALLAVAHGVGRVVVTENIHDSWIWMRSTVETAAFILA
jgi:hypothetical protein